MKKKTGPAIAKQNSLGVSAGLPGDKGGITRGKARRSEPQTSIRKWDTSEGEANFQDLALRDVQGKPALGEKKKPTNGVFPLKGET